MIKFFTIIFLLYYIFRVFKPSFMVETINKLNQDFKDFDNTKDEREKEDFVINRLIPILGRFSLVCLVVIPLTVAEFIYMFSAVQYGNKIITIGFIIFYFLFLIIELVKSKLQEEKFKKIKKFTFERLFINMIHATYFGYMYYILFLV